MQILLLFQSPEHKEKVSVDSQIISSVPTNKQCKKTELKTKR